MTQKNTSRTKHIYETNDSFELESNTILEAKHVFMILLFSLGYFKLDALGRISSHILSIVYRFSKLVNPFRINKSMLKNMCLYCQ